MPLTPADITKSYPIDGNTVERIAHRKSRLPILIVEYNPAWPLRFQQTKTQIESALGPTAIFILHAGSTSVPGLPAKDVIDIDLVVADVDDESAYVQPLEDLGFRFLLREPGWHRHRFFVDEGDRPDSYHVNLHVFPQGCAEVERHQIFRNWLIKHPEDMQLYADVKREVALKAEEAGESMQLYTDRKDEVVGQILGRAFRELGYITDDDEKKEE